MTVAVDPNALVAKGGANTSGPINKIDPSLPQVFGRYLLVQRLSRGGMGEIFLAKHGLQGFEKLCVIKKVLPNLAEDESFISRFVDEAQVAIKLQHVNIAQVFEVGRVGDEYFLAIEYVEGRDLRRTLQVMGRRKLRFPPELALFIGREVANGLAYAHRRTGADGSSLNLVHCDISPPNVLVSFEGETKIIDFGIAKSALRATATDPKMGFGKFGYMAPEQLIRGGVVDHRTDIYAAGVVLYELLTGERLYDLGQDGAPDYRALARAVSRGEHRLPSDLDPMLAPHDELVQRALRPKLEDRYQTAAEFRDAIQTALVQLSPTISSDQLGAFLRQVFADEMNAHQELVERVAHLHLDDFKEQLTTQSVATVSFALANMPLLAPHEPAQPRQPPITGVVGSAPTGTIELADLDLVMGDQTFPASHRRRWPVIASVAAFGIGVGVMFVIASHGGREQTPASPPPAPPAAAVAPVAQVAPIAMAPTPTQPVVTPLEVEIAEPAAPAPPTPRKAAAKKATPKRVEKVTKIEKNEPVAPAPAIDAGAVLSKFKALSREYRAFKSAYGSRLDGDWTDLATSAQYANRSPDKLKELDRKIDRFRALMQAQK